MSARTCLVPAALLAMHCSSSEPAKPPLLAGCEGPRCTDVPVGGGGPSGGGDAGALVDAVADAGDAPTADVAAESAEGVTVTVRVGRTTDDRFLAAAYDDTESVVVRAQGAAGAIVSTPTEGIVPPATLGGVALGSNWFSLSSSAAAGGKIFPTLEPVVVAADAVDVNLVAIDREELGIVATSLLVTLDGSAAHAVLIFAKAGSPLRGVSIGGAPAGSIVAYDTASGYAADDHGATGAAGTVLLLNVPPAPPPSLTYDTGRGPTPLAVEFASGYATWASVDVP
jgi:hypothetical protein